MRYKNLFEMITSDEYKKEHDTALIEQINLQHKNHLIIKKFLIEERGWPEELAEAEAWKYRVEELESSRIELQSHCSRPV